MNVYIPLTLFLVLLCYFTRKNQVVAERTFLFSMIAMTVFAALRYNFGPDYYSYHSIYNNIQGESINNYTGEGSSLELLFLRYMSLFPKFTYFVAVNSILWFTVYYLFIRNYACHDYYWLVLLALCYNSSAIIGSMVAMRTAICGILFVIALYFLLKERRLIYVAIIIIASLIHTSAIVLVLFGLINTKRNSVVFSTPFIIICAIIGFSSVIIGENVLVSSLTSFIIDNVEELQRYENYSAGAANQSLLSFIFRVLAFIVFLYLESAAKKETDQRYIIIYKIGIWASLLQLLLGQNMVSDRFRELLNPVFFVALIQSIRYTTKQRSFLAIGSMMMIAIYLFYIKMGKEYSESFWFYHTIFSAPQIP